MLDAGAFKRSDDPDTGMGADPYPDSDEDYLAAVPDIHGKRLPRMYQPFDIVSQPVGVENRERFRVDSQPDYWLIAVEPSATMAVSVYVEIEPVGEPVRLNTGGAARLPGRGTDLCVVSTGSIPASYTVVAVRGFSFEIRVQRGIA